MKSKLALSAVVALSALVGCNAPNNGTSPSGGTTSAGGSGGGSGGATTGSGGTSSIAGGSSGGTSGKTDSGGTTSSGGAATGGATGSGGATTSGGSTGSGGTARSGGASASGGSAGSAGATASGGSTGSGGAARSGGAGASGGSTRSGGATASGGSTGSGGTTPSGGASASGGSSGTGGQRPCDIYQAASPPTPCAAAHSTVRALYGGYTGPLYQVRKGSNTKDIPVGADGYVNISEQDSFCSGGGCTISLIYDQSPNKNNLPKSPDTLWLKNSKEANATDGKITISGHTAYGVYIDNPGANVGYRQNTTKGMPVKDEAEAMYMVLDGTRFSDICCFDYGNAETVGTDAGSATMEALYWGTSVQFSGSTGMGKGPWVAADLENGMYAGDSTAIGKQLTTTNTSITGWKFVTGMLKGPSGPKMGLKAGDAQSGKLETKWDGNRPPGYSPMKKQGSIILGTGGDGSNYGKGTFWEGAITVGNPTDATDDLVQANIVAAGYGK